MPIVQDLARNLGMLVSEAAGQRSRQAGVVQKADRPLPPGTLMQGVFDVGAGAVKHTPAATPAAITSILLYWADATYADVAGTFLVRDCEVNDAYLVLGAMDRDAVVNALAKVGIIVRTGVLTAPGATYAVPRNTDPALADSLYGPLGLETIPTVSGGAGSLTGGSFGGTEVLTGDRARVDYSPSGGALPRVERPERHPADERERGEAIAESPPFGGPPPEIVGQPPHQAPPSPDDAPSQPPQRTDTPATPSPPQGERP